MVPPRSLTFSVTHREDSLRTTHPTDFPPSAEEGWFVGCSFTHGWGLNDSDTFAWKIQENSSSVEIINFGVSGYGTPHSLIQFKTALADRHKPRFAAIDYTSLHAQYNTFLRGRRKAVASWNNLGPLKQPYARLASEKLVIGMTPVDYAEWPLQRELALVNFLETLYDKYKDIAVGSNEVTKAILREFIAVANASGMPVVMFGIFNDQGMRDMLDYAKAWEFLQSTFRST